MLSSMVYVIVYLIDFVDFKALLCGSRDLLESLMPGNETPLCIISGTYIHYPYIKLYYLNTAVVIGYMGCYVNTHIGMSN